MSMFGIFSGDKKKQNTVVTTSTQQADSSRNLGSNAVLLEQGSSLVTNDLSERVASESLASTSDVAKTAIGGSTAVATTLGNGALELAKSAVDSSIDRISDANANVTLAAQNAVSYGRQLAEVGLSAKTSADSGGATAAIDTAGKYTSIIVIGMAVVAVGFLIVRKKL